MHGNMIFSICSVTVVFVFPTHMILPFCQKSKNGLFPKNTLKDDIFGVIGKDDIHLRKYGTSSDRKIKDDKKVYLVKSL